MSAAENVLLVLLALFLVLLNGFFVAAEFSMVKLRHTRVEELRRLHGFRGRILMVVHQHLDSYLSACQLGITLASLGLGWVGEPAFASLLEGPLRALGLDNPASIHTISFIVAFATISYLHIVVGELAPKSTAIRLPEATSLWTAVPLYLFFWGMYPFIWMLNASANWVLRRAGLETGGSGHGHESPYSHDELRMILHLSRAASNEPDEEINRVLAHTLELSKLHASDVMRSRRDLATIRSDASHAEVRRTLQTLRYSRYPCIDAGTGDVVGVLHLKDLFLENPGPDFAERLRGLVRPIEQVHEDAPLSILLRKFRLGAPHLALVHDADGRAIGFVTMEDVLEAVFGQITDEHEKGRSTQVSRDPQTLDDGSLLVRGDTPLFLVERALGETFAETESINTVSGLLMQRLGQMPEAGARIDLGGYTANVLKLRGPNVESVHIVRRVDGVD